MLFSGQLPVKLESSLLLISSLPFCLLSSTQRIYVNSPMTHGRRPKSFDEVIQRFIPRISPSPTYSWLLSDLIQRFGGIESASGRLKTIQILEAMEMVYLFDD